MKSGFTLLESLLTVALAGVIFSVMGRIFHDYARLRQVAQTRSSEVEVAEQGLRSLCRQLRQAADWREPRSGSASRVVWLRYDQPVQNWLEQPAPPVSETVEVIDRELRQGPIVLCRSVEQLEIERPEQNLLKIRLKIPTRTLHATVWRRP